MQTQLNTTEFYVFDKLHRVTVVYADGQCTFSETDSFQIAESGIKRIVRLDQARRRKKGLSTEVKTVDVTIGCNVVAGFDANLKDVGPQHVECNDCGQTKKRKLSGNWRSTYSGDKIEFLSKDSYERHVCTPREEPLPGYTYKATFGRGVAGIIGGYSVELRLPNGKICGGLMSSQQACEQLLRVWGFKPPFAWTFR